MVESVKAPPFLSLDHYNQSLERGYKLLPFRFIRLDATRYVVTNEVGEFVIASAAELHALVDGKLEVGSKFYNQLKSKHMIFDEDSNVAIDLLALKVRTKFSQISQFTGLHMFVVSLRCDHSCPYCQVSRQSEDRLAFDMTEETAAKGLDVVFQSPSDHVKIEFQGGEPLLNFELIQWVVKEANRRNETAKKDLQFVIATNLALLTDEILEFARKNEMFFSTSLDGPEDLHVANRPRPGGDSYKRTIAGIKRIRNEYGVDKVSALMTTTERSLGRGREIIDEYLKQGFDAVFLRPLSPYGFAIKTKSFAAYDAQRWLDFYFDGLDYIIELNKRGVPFMEQYASIILTKIFSPFGTGYVDLQSPAGLGISAVAFNYDGEVYASDEGRMLAEMGDTTFRMGNLKENNYEELFLSDNLLEAIESSITESVPGCNDCGFQPYCGSDPSYHYATQKDFVGHKAFSSFCKRNMAIMRRLFTLLTDDEQARKILMSWVRI